MTPRDDAAILDLLKAANLIQEFIASMKKEAFLQDIKTQSAVLHQLLLLGETVKRLSEELRYEHPDIPWKKVAGMRDKLIHQYDTVDFEEVWKTVGTDLPRIVALIEPLAPKKQS